MGKVVLKMQVILLVAGLAGGHPKIRKQLVNDVGADGRVDGKPRRPPTQSSQPAAAPGASGDWLAHHNEKRRLHQGTPDLVSDQELITKAQGCADGMARSGVFQHCSTGENLYSSFGLGGDLYQAAVDGWYEEGAKFGWRFGVDSFSSDTGHFTQVIWASATKVGCAMARGTQWTYVVCNYDAGNMMGQFNQNVLPQKPVAAAPADPEATTAPATTPAPAAAAPGAPEDWLGHHNEVRRRHRNTPDLVADQELITKAQGCADGMARSGVFQHCSTGENLYSSFGIGGDLYKAALDSWYTEGRGWRYGQGLGFSSGTGHFTQVVWAATSRVGCARAQGTQWTFVVCNYSPPGNFRGAFDRNVLPVN